MAAKKSKSESYLSVENLGELADSIMALEEKSLKKWNKKPAIKRGEDLRYLIEKKFPGIGEEALDIAMWVDLYIYTRDSLFSADGYFSLMEIDEAITSLMKYEKKNSSEFEYIKDWVSDFGCLLTEGSGSDIGAWFHDWFFEPLTEIGAIVYGENLYLENPTKTQLGKLAKSESLRDRVQAALHLKTESDLLVRLATDAATAVRLAVAQNPSTPGEVLDKLSRDSEEVVVQAALENESISIKTLESADGETASISLASSKKATAETLAKLAKEKDEEIRVAVANNENTSAEVLTLLAKDKSSEVREGVASNPNTPHSALKLLAKDKDDFVRGYLASRDRLSEELMQLLAKDKDTWVREQLAENESASKEILEILSKDSESSVREKAISNEKVSEQLVKEIKNPIAVTLAIAGNRSTPSDLLEEFSANAELIYHQGKTLSLAMAVAGNLSIPDSVMRLLLKSKQKEVLAELAANPSLSANYLDELVETSLKRIKAGKSSWSDRDLELGLAKNPNSPQSYLTAVLQHSDSWVVATAASNPNLPPQQMAKLAKSEHENIRQGVASNINAPWALLQSLSKDADCTWQIAENPSTRAEELSELALRKETGPFVLADIARNPSASPELIQKLAKHKDAWVRLGVARNPNTAPALVEKILKDFLKLQDDEHDGDSYIVRCERTPAEMIESVLERYLPINSRNRSSILSSIGANPNTNFETLNLLAEDRSMDARVAVAGNPNTSGDTLRQMSR